MGKKPKTEFSPKTEKLPRLQSDPEGFHKRNPAWRLRRLELADPFGWHAVSRETLLDVHAKLSDFETMTWAELLGGKQNHNVSVSDLCKAARQRLEEIGQDDIDELLSLRLSGKERVWGILSEGVYTLLWWDPEHQVCPSVKG